MAVSYHEKGSFAISRSFHKKSVIQIMVFSPIKIINYFRFMKSKISQTTENPGFSFQEK